MPLITRTEFKMEIYGSVKALVGIIPSRWNKKQTCIFNALIENAKPIAFKQAMIKGWNNILDNDEIIQCASEGAFETLNYFNRNNNKIEEIKGNEPLFYSILTMRIIDELRKRGSENLGQRHGRDTQRIARKVRKLEAEGFTAKEIQDKLNISELQYQRYSDDSYDNDGGISRITEQQERELADTEYVNNNRKDWDEFKEAALKILSALPQNKKNKNIINIWILMESADTKQKDIAEKSGLTASRVGQLQKEIYEILSKHEELLYND